MGWERGTAIQRDGERRGQSGQPGPGESWLVLVQEGLDLGGEGLGLVEHDEVEGPVYRAKPDALQAVIVAVLSPESGAVFQRHAVHSRICQCQAVLTRHPGRCHGP